MQVNYIIPAAAFGFTFIFSIANYFYWNEKCKDEQINNENDLERERYFYNHDA